MIFMELNKQCTDNIVSLLPNNNYSNLNRNIALAKNNKNV